MKKTFTILMMTLVVIMFTACNQRKRIWEELDELDGRVTALEESVKKINSDINAMQTILNALQNNLYVTNVITTQDGYTIQFSDGTSAVISNGHDGVNAPIISVRQDVDGYYYWTLDGEWLIVDGNKVRATGKDGVDGTNGVDGVDGTSAITPQVRINEDTKEWEISTDGGITWVSTGVIAEGQDGTNGTNGTNGTDGITPQISIAQDVDGNYYWTLDGEWIIVNGAKVRANGFDGGSGTNGLAPQIRINLETYEWEVSTDGGLTWTSTGVVAQGADGDSFFQNVDVSNPDYVIVTMADGSVILLERYDGSAPMFVIVNVPEIAQIEYGTSVSYNVEAENVAEYIINTPQGWTAEYENNALTITAPAKDLCHYDKEGKISITVVSESGKVAIIKVNVMAGEWVSDVELRILTFEDSDALFAPYTLYNGASIETWSDLIDDMQYGGSLTYTDYMTDEYWWYDEGNTGLFHSFETPYWGGGHVISNYVTESYETLPDGYYGWYQLQMSTPIGGHNGSSNFAVHNGYSDFFNSQMYDASLEGFEFADGVERVIDHMYVTNTNYVLNSLTYGDGFNSPATESTYFKIVAFGYNANDEEVGSLEFTLCDGASNILKTWEKWDLSPLGKVAKIVFNFDASDDQSGSYGLNTPAYFAYDDVAVQFEGETVFR